MRKLKMQDVLAGFIALGASVAMVSCGGGGTTTSSQAVSGYVTDGPISASVFVYNAYNGQLNLCGTGTSDENNGGAFNISLTGANCGSGPYLIRAVVISSADGDVGPGDVLHYIAKEQLSNIYVNPANDSFVRSLTEETGAPSTTLAFVLASHSHSFTNLETNEEQYDNASISFAHVYFAYSTTQSVTINGRYQGSYTQALVEKINYPLNQTSSGVIPLRYSRYVYYPVYNVLIYQHNVAVVPSSELSATSLTITYPYKPSLTTFATQEGSLSSQSFTLLSSSDIFGYGTEIVPESGTGSATLFITPSYTKIITFPTYMPLPVCSITHSFSSTNGTEEDTLSVPCSEDGTTSLTKTVSIKPYGEALITISGTIAGIPVPTFTIIK